MQRPGLMQKKAAGLIAYHDCGGAGPGRFRGNFELYEEGPSRETMIHPSCHAFTQQSADNVLICFSTLSCVPPAVTLTF